MNERRKRWDNYTIVILLLLIILLFLLVFVNVKIAGQKNEEANEVGPTQQIVYITPSPTPIVVYVTPTPTPVPTQYVIYVTPVPTIEPTATIPYVNEENVSKVTPVPTATPIPTPTGTPVPTATPIPTPTGTPVPTATPTATPVPVVPITPTTSPDDIGKENLEIIKREVSRMMSGADILVSKKVSPQHDLYDIISTDNVNQKELFEVLSSFCVNNMARFINITTFKGSTPLDSLNSALNSAVCPSCGKLLRKYNEANTAALQNIIVSISENDFEAANKIMLDFLHNHSSINPNNANERLILVCSD